MWCIAVFQSMNRSVEQADSAAILVTGTVLLVPSIPVVSVSIFLLRFASKIGSIVGLFVSLITGISVLIWPSIFVVEGESPMFFTRLVIFVLTPILFVHCWFASMLSFSNAK